jgi:hypothetical protein
LQYGNVRDFSLSIETADTGSIADPAISAFNDWQVEAVATIIAYESHLNGFPVEFLGRWFGTGVGSHTEPDEYPFTTLFPGKFCPGSKKKAQVKAEILPEARHILTTDRRRNRTHRRPCPRQGACLVAGASRLEHRRRRVAHHPRR